jgi:CTP:molybdopterin cytidylyltransferase MocA
MGRPKLALPLGDRTVLEHVIAALKTGGAERVVVVVGPHVPELVPLAEAAGAGVCRLSETTADMRATVERGLAWLEDPTSPRPEAFLLAPADHPTLDAAVVRALCGSFRSDPSKSILIPTHGGRRGHPVLFGWHHVHGIRALPADCGINTYVREHAAAVREIEVGTPSVLWDLDTPEDYDRCRTGF